MLRSHLQTLSTLLGRPPPVLTEERDPTEVEFLSGVHRLVANAKGQVFPTSIPGTQLNLVSITKPVEDAATEQFEFVVPLVVKYEGTAEPEVWAEAEKAMEARFLDAIRSTAVDYMGDDAKVQLVRRRKSDPFKGDPRSLTILRFRVT